jgi:5-methyltetrahydrofolate--homocysteine methyltransferase
MANRKPRIQRLSYSDALANRALFDWDTYEAPPPSFLGVRVFDDVSIESLVETIDWTPFFITWELAGKYPNILDDAVVGEQARDLFCDARAMPQQIVDEKWLEARAVLGFWRAHSNGEDIVLDTGAGEPVLLHHLRQQGQKQNGQPNFSLSDYVAPADDFIGGFCVSTGHGVAERAAAFEAAHDDYNAILLKALADRLAESLAEHMHRRVRRELWGYAPQEALNNDDLIRERYRGIRPAPGYPACPDHTEKRTLFDLLEAESNCGVTLSESYAMDPAASVSGWYFAHPEARYFAVGKIGEDQLESIAARKSVSVDEMRRWLSPNLD